MLLNAASVIFTVIVLNFHHRTSETHTMPRWVSFTHTMHGNLDAEGGSYLLLEFSFPVIQPVNLV